VDPRNYQITALGAFVTVGTIQLGFQINPLNAVAIIATALLAQHFLFSPGQSKSALISSLSLVLLLRTDTVAVAALAGFIAIASKRVIRVNGSHIFNPSALALVVTTALFLFFTTAAILFFRGVYLGDPMAIAWHQIQNGALLLFTFFMITDPKTTPINRRARVAFGIVVALFAANLQLNLYVSAAPIYSLVVLAPLVPVLNLITSKRKKDYVQKNTNYNVFGQLLDHWQSPGVLRFLRRQS